MKKALSILLAVLLILSLASCGGKGSSAGADSPSNGAGSGSGIESALELLTKVWDSYGEDDKFPAIGGDMAEENLTDGAPGKFGIDDADALDATLGFPAASAGEIDDAASLVHMMNANTFTCGAYRAVNAEGVDGLCEAIKTNIKQRQWMCGFPEKLVIMTVDNYVVAMFGTGDLTDTFKTQLTSAYAAAAVYCDEPIM